MLAFVQGERSDGGAGAGTATSVTDFTRKERAQTRLNEGPCAHVLRFFLAPDQSGVFGEGFHDSTQLRFVQRVKLFDPGAGGVSRGHLAAILMIK